VYGPVSIVKSSSWCVLDVVAKGLDIELDVRVFRRSDLVLGNDGRETVVDHEAQLFR
jgi:hypothetical protein